MKDLSKLSREELIALDQHLTSQIGDEPAPGTPLTPKVDPAAPYSDAPDLGLPDISGMGIDELKRIDSILSHAIGDQPKPKRQPAPESTKPMPPVIDARQPMGLDYDFSGRQAPKMIPLHPVDPATAAAADVASIDTRMRAYPTPGAPYGLPIPGIDAKTAGKALQSLADVAAPLTTILNNQFPQLRQAVDEKNRLLARRNAGENISPRGVRTDAAIMGALHATDALANLIPANVILPGLPDPFPALRNDKGAIDLAGKFRQIPRVAQESKESPAMFNQSQMVGEFAAPVPGLGNVPAKAAAIGKAVPLVKDIPAITKGLDLLEALGKGVDKGKFLPNIANDATQGALVNALLTQGAARKEGKNASINEVATAAGIGAGGGGLLGTVIHGAGPALNAIRKGMGAASKHAYKFSPKDLAVQESARNSAAPTIEELAKMFPESEEFAALLRHGTDVHGNVIHPQSTATLDHLFADETAAARGAQPQAGERSISSMLTDADRMRLMNDADFEDHVLRQRDLTPEIEAEIDRRYSQRSANSAQHALDNIDYELPQAQRSAHNALDMIDYSTAPKEPADPWVAALDKVKSAASTSERVDALRQAEIIRKQQLQGLPKTGTKKEIAKRLTDELNQADAYAKGRAMTQPPSRSAQQTTPPPIEPARLDRPVEPGTGLARDNAELKRNEAEYQPSEKEIQRQTEKAKFPAAFEPLHEDGSRLRGYEAQFASSLQHHELEDHIEDIHKELARPSNQTKSGELRKSAEVNELKRQLDILVAEKMRREFRKVKGLEPDHAPDDFTQLSDVSLSRAAGRTADAGDLETTQKLLDELEARYATEEAAQSGNAEPQPTTEGDPAAFRYKAPEKLGRQKYTDRGFDVDAIRSRLPHLRDHADDLAAASRDLVQAKINHDYADQLAQHYGEQLFNHFKDHAVKGEDGELVLKAHGHTITQRDAYESTRALDRFLQNLHYDLGNGEVYTKAAKHTEVGLAEDFRKTGMLQDIPLPKTKDINSPEAKQAFETLKRLKHAALDANDHLSKVVKPSSADLLERAELMHRDAAEGQHLTLNAGGQLHHLDLNTGAKLPEPVAEVRGQVQHVQESWGKKLDESARTFYEEIKTKVTPLLGHLQTKTGVRAPNRKKLLGAGGLIGALVAGGEARASDLVHAAATTPHTFWQQAIESPATGPLLAAATVATAGRKVAKTILNSRNVWANKMFNDTMHAVGYLDKWLAERGVPDAESLEKQLWVDNLGTAYRATFGVPFESQAHRIEAVNALRDKSITPEQALKGEGIFADLDQRQREAIVTYQGIQSNMLKLVKGRKKLLDEILANDSSLLDKTGQKIADGRLRNGRDALVYLERALGPRAEMTEGEKAFAYLASNFMDYNFWWNPEFHGTNLSDAWIAGGMRVGPINIARAHAMLSPVGGDAELKALFKASNLVGSNTTERARLAVEKGRQGFQLPEIEDIPTDKINADRVALGAMLQFAQRADIRPQLEKAGIKSDADFVKKALTSREIDPELVASCWGHVAETAARTLGVDPYRLCLDFVSMSSNSPAWGVFVRQPARIASLMTHALAEGNFKGLMRMLGMTALIGGSSAMPAEVRESWKRIDPRGYFQAAKFLDDHSLGAVTGETLAPKLEWAFLYPLMAAALPMKDTIAEIGDDSERGFDLALKHSAELAQNPKEAATALMPELAKWGSLMLRAVGSSVMPRIGGVVPTRAVAKTLQAAQQASDGEVKVYLPNVRGAQAPAAKINLDEAGIPRYVPFLDQLIPGTPNYKYAAQQAAAEKKAKKKYEDRTGIDLLGSLAPSYSESNRYGGDVVNLLKRR